MTALPDMKVSREAAAQLALWFTREGLDNLYELVPAFFMAGFAALAISAITPISGEDRGK